MNRGQATRPHRARRRRWDTRTEGKPAKNCWQDPPPCGYCRKRGYDTRRTARRAMRALYPDEVGTLMAVYPCPGGGQGWHIGHVDQYVRPPAEWPSWADADADTPCTGCRVVTLAGDPVAWIRGLALCLECGDLAERQALAS